MSFKLEATEMAAPDDAVVVHDWAPHKRREQSQIEMTDLRKAGGEMMKDAIRRFNHGELPARAFDRRRLITEILHDRRKLLDPFGRTSWKLMSAAELCPDLFSELLKSLSERVFSPFGLQGFQQQLRKP